MTQPKSSLSPSPSRRWVTPKRKRIRSKTFVSLTHYAALRRSLPCLKEQQHMLATWLNSSSFALRISQGKSINLNRAMSAHL